MTNPNPTNPITAAEVSEWLAAAEITAAAADPKKVAKALRKTTRKAVVAEVEAILADLIPSSSAVKDGYKKAYARNELKHTCSDDIAHAFAQLTQGHTGDDLMEVLVKVGEANGLAVEDRWGHLRNKDGSRNTGMIRMNLGNVLRNAAKRGEKVAIADRAFGGEA